MPPTAVIDPLVAAARRGDVGAFETLVRRHGPAMHACARRLLVDDGAAQEAVQDAFLAAWRGLDDYRGDARLNTWLFSLTTHKAIDVGRRQHPVPAGTTPAQPDTCRRGTPGPADEAGESAFLAALESTLTTLPRVQRACWTLREVHGLSAAETGQLMELSPGAVRGQVNRARTALAAAMSAWR